MPNCRNCGSRLSRFNSDMCPVCGCKHPFEGAPTDTLDITQEIKTVKSSDVNGYKRKSKKVSFWLSVFFGWTGASLYYLKFNKQGIIYSLVSLLVNAGLFVALFIGLHWDWYFAILLPIGVALLAGFILGFILYKPDLKDGRGEFLR